MNKKRLLGSAAVIALVVVALVQFIPPEPVVVPARLPEEQRAAHRHLAFEGIHNFRDLGGYPTLDGRHTRWGVMYRSGHLGEASRADVEVLARLGLHTLVDFRTAQEKLEQPDRLPEPTGFQVIELPTLDGGEDSVAAETMARLRAGDLEGFDPDSFMIAANRDFAHSFNEQYHGFMQAMLAAQGEPVLWHCSAGKDRAGFAAAILLRTLGVSEEVVMDDYLLSKRYAHVIGPIDSFLARLFKGEEMVEKFAVMMGVEHAWLQAGLDEIDQRYGNFDGYVREVLQLSDADVAALKDTLLE